MAVIKIEQIKLHAYHGCLPEEAEKGQIYYVDVSAEGDFSKAILSDNLADAVDYCVVYDAVKKEMATRSKLIEHVCGRIFVALKNIYPHVKITVTVIKPSPPVNGEVKQAVFTLEG
jgi:7,8-dihydroneopterin aldolase/epimerase/oxygenase